MTRLEKLRILREYQRSRAPQNIDRFALVKNYLDSGGPERTAARLAAENGVDFFTTTLTLSPLKDAQLLNRLGIELGEKHGVPFFPSDFKKRDGYLRSLALSRQYGLYRQDYCGCIFSKQERGV